MKLYPGYLFDLDGTLVDTAPDINAALNYALASRGCPGVDEAVTRHWVGHGARVLVTQAIERNNLDDGLLDELVAVFIEFYENNIATHSRPYPGVIKTLDTLRSRGAVLAVVTNKLTRFSVPLLAALELDPYFSAIVCGDTTSKSKPAAEPALHACDQLAVPPEEALFVGDSETDVACARAACGPVVVVRDGYNHGTPASELGADGVIESFYDLV